MMSNNLTAMTATAAIQLAPCPFCGGHARLRQEMTRDRTLESVTCDDCNIRFSRNTADDAAAAWNRRATIQAAEAQPSQPQPLCNSALRAEPAGQHDAGAAVLSALRDGIQLQEPVNITKAVLAQREARVSLSGGTGPVACAMLVNIQLTGWAEGPEKAEAFASGYNTAMKWYRSVLLDLAEQVSADAATRCRAEGGITSKTTAESLVEAPQGAAVAQDDSPFQSQGWSKEAEMIESWRGAAEAPILQPVGEFIGYDGETSAPLVKWASMPKVGDTLYAGPVAAAQPVAVSDEARRIGGQMSNVLFNYAQNEKMIPSPDERDRIKRLQVRWDEVTRCYVPDDSIAGKDGAS